VSVIGVSYFWLKKSRTRSAAEWAYNYDKEKAMDYLEFKIWKAAVILAIIFLAGIWKGMRGG
jgi:hypothetical protein